jgi:4-cresol dehydrogenase (hydroxylating)
MSAALLRELSGQFQVAAWMGVGSMYGSREHIAATRALIKRVLRPHVQRLLFADGARVSRAHRVLQRLPGRLASRLALTTGKMLGGLDLMAGKPSEVALPLAYWKARVPPGTSPLNPARDGCGLLWYSPIVPMRPERARAYVELARRTCRKHGLDAPITFTSLSERAFDSTLPLLFARDNAEEAARAKACYEELFSAGLAEGFVPYRVGVSLLSRLVDARCPFWRMVGHIKDSLDPAGILAPGRYAPIPPHQALHEEDTRPEAFHPA